MEREKREELVAAYLDGVLTPEEAAELVDELRRDPELRRYLLRAAGTDVALHELESAQAARGRSSRPSARHASRPRRSWHGTPAFVAASILAAAAILIIILPGRRPAPTPPRDTALERLPREEAPAPSEEERRPERGAVLPPKPVPEEKRDAPRKETPRPEPAPPPRVEPPRPSETPSAPPKPEESVRPQTQTVVATVERAEGTCFVLAEGEEKPARAGTGLLSGQGLETSGAKSLAVVRVADGTRLELGADSSVRAIEEHRTAGTRVALTAGTLAADVVRRPQDRPFVFVTPHGEARVLGTSLRLTVDATSVRLEVTEGKVRLTRSADSKFVDVFAGHYAVAAVGVDLAAKTLPRSVSFGGAGAKTQDTYLYGYASHEGGNFGARDSMMITANGPAVALLRFPTLLGTAAGQLPPRSTVHSATLRLKCLSNGPGTPLSLKFFRCLKPWIEGRGDGGIAQRGEPTWKASQSGGVAWEVAGAEGRTDRSTDSWVAEAKVDAAHFITFDVTPIVQAWVRGEANYGFILAPAPKLGDARFSTSEDPVPADRPLLTVEYSK